MLRALLFCLFVLALMAGAEAAAADIVYPSPHEEGLAIPLLLSIALLAIGVARSLAYAWNGMKRIAVRTSPPAWSRKATEAVTAK